MIIVRSPLRITLGGGGTDLPSYYEAHTGFVISAAIDKYVYIILNRTFERKILLKYSQMEHVQEITEIQHPLMRESLAYVGISEPHLEITSMADIPAGTGLGSSGSFTTALLKALHTLKRNPIHPRELAEQACHIEINLLQESVGKQDQYIAAFGGITCFHFLSNHQVEATPLNISQDTLYDLDDNLLLFFTGFSRAASSILQEQDTLSKNNHREMLDNLHFIKALGFESQKLLEAGDVKAFAELMNVHWEYKKKRSTKMTNAEVDAWYTLARKNGALGGKIIGAGGGGFLMFYADDKIKLRQTLKSAGLQEVRFRFDFSGTQVITQ